MTQTKQQRSINGIEVTAFKTDDHWLVKHSSSGLLQLSRAVYPTVDDAFNAYWVKILKPQIGSSTKFIVGDYKVPAGVQVRDVTEELDHSDQVPETTILAS